LCGTPLWESLSAPCGSLRPHPSHLPLPGYPWGGKALHMGASPLKFLILVSCQPSPVPLTAYPSTCVSGRFLVPLICALLVEKERTPNCVNSHRLVAVCQPWDAAILANRNAIFVTYLFLVVSLCCHSFFPLFITMFTRFGFSFLPPYLCFIYLATRWTSSLGRSCSSLNPSR
jgi:hypothetical protein